MRDAIDAAAAATTTTTVAAATAAPTTLGTAVEDAILSSPSVLCSPDVATRENHTNGQKNDEKRRKKDESLTAIFA